MTISTDPRIGDEPLGYRIEALLDGYFSGTTTPPTRTSPACRRGNPPPWSAAVGG